MDGALHKQTTCTRTHIRTSHLFTLDKHSCTCSAIKMWHKPSPAAIQFSPLLKKTDWAPWIVIQMITTTTTIIIIPIIIYKIQPFQYGKRKQQIVNYIMYEYRKFLALSGGGKGKKFCHPLRNYYDLWRLLPPNFHHFHGRGNTHWSFKNVNLNSLKFRSEKIHLHLLSHKSIKVCLANISLTEQHPH